MKKIAFLFALFLTVFITSCDNSFLDENRKTQNGYTLDVPLFVEPTSEFVEVSVQIPQLKNTRYKVMQYPKIIYFESFSGNIDETGLLKLKIKVDNFDNSVSRYPQRMGSIILKIDNDKLLEINVLSVNYGEPVLKVNPTSYDFAKSSSEFNLTIGNSGTGFLFAKIESQPNWLRIEPYPYIEQDENGFAIIPQSNAIEYRLSVNRQGLNIGTYEGEIKIISNDTKHSVYIIPVKMEVRENKNPDNVLPLNGMVVDCEFDKSTNMLYVASSVENKVVVVNIASQKIVKEITLNRNVNAISLSENNSKLFVGQSGLVSVYNTSDLSLHSQIEIDFMASDVIDGQNGYYYIAKKDGDFESYFYSYDLATQKLYPSGAYHDKMEGNSFIKIANKPYILTTRINTSPSGVTLADIKNGKPVYINYWHQDFGNRFWQKEDGSIIIGRRGHIFKTPNPQTSSSQINTLGVLKPNEREGNEYGYSYNWIDLNSQTQSIWGAMYDMHNLHYLPNKSVVFEWNENTYTIKRTIPVDEYYTEIKGKKDFYATIAHYVFSTKEGNKIVLVKNVVDPDDSYTTAPLIKAWHLEIIDVTK